MGRTLRTQAAQVGRLRVAVGADDHVQVGPDRPGVLDDQAGLVDIGGSDDQHPRPLQVDQLEDLRVRRVPEDRGDAARAQFVDLVALLGDHHVAKAASLEGRRRSRRPTRP